MFRRIVIVGILSAGLAARAQEGVVSLGLAEQMEEAVYLQEAQLDLEGAIRVYQGILAESRLVDSLAAEAKYRLAICYLDQGKRSLALMTLEGLVREYPGEARWVAEAKQLLPQEFEPQITPWFDGERSHYEWRNPAGSVLGRSFSTLQRLEREGRSLWRKETRYFLNGDRSLVVEFEPDTFHTAYSEMKSPEVGGIRAWYSDDGKSVEVEYENNQMKRSFDFEGRLYDNEQAYELMRQMPLEVGYSMTKNIFVPMSGVPIPIIFTVAEITEMETALGTLDCYRVELDLQGPKQRLFMTADERRILVKVAVGGIEAELVKLDTIRPGEESVYWNDSYGFELRHPDEWVAVENPDRGEWEEVRVEFGEPTLQGGFSLYSDTNEKIGAEALVGIEAFIKYIQDEEAPRRKESEIDPDWERRLSFNGLEAMAFKMTPTEATDSEFDRYTYVALSDKRHYIFHAFLREELVAEQLPKFERLVQSLSEKD